MKKDNDFGCGTIIMVSIPLIPLLIIILKLTSIIDWNWGDIIFITLLIWIPMGFMLLVAFSFISIGKEATDLNAVKKLKWFLGLDFQGDYTVIKYEEQPIHGDHPLYISISVSDESFKEIATFLESVELIKEEEECNNLKGGDSFVMQQLKDGSMIFGHNLKDANGWHKPKDANIFIKTDNEYNYIVRLVVDCDNRTLSLNAFGY